MPVEEITGQALNELLLTEWRKIPGCEKVEEVAVRLLDSPRGDVNWDLGHSPTNDFCRNKLYTLAEPFRRKYKLIQPMSRRPRS